MLFEKSKENLEITTWYHKSFPSAPRLSEGGRGPGVLEGTTLRAYLSLRAVFQPTALMTEIRGTR